MSQGDIIIRRARVNNLKDITVEIPRNSLVVVTGISGSGKSSLAFDTLFAEGQRRFAQSLSSYARQFLGRMSKPDVDSIEGIPPAIAIEQKVNIRNPRSTVGTTTEIYDYLRMIYARIGRTYSPISGQEVRCNTTGDVMEALLDGRGGAAWILADIGWDAREDKVELLLDLKSSGFNRLYDTIHLQQESIDDVLQGSEKGFPAGLCLLVDRARLDHPDEDLRTRLRDSVATAFQRGGGTVLVAREADGGKTLQRFCDRMERDGMTFRKPDEYLFSFNSPLGACPVCGGLGKIIGISEDLVIPDKTLSIYDGAIACWRGEKMGWFREDLIRKAERYGIPLFEPWCKLPPEVTEKIWRGVPAPTEEERLWGIDDFFRWVDKQKYKIQFKYMMSRYSGRTVCHSCGGSRLRPEALYVKVGGKTIHELLRMNVDMLLDFLEHIDLTPYEHDVADKAIGEICFRLRCIRDVGLSYLTLDRTCNTLSGGESQRVNLVTALGSSLVGSMYILDEPSIGLHPRDTERLIAVLRRLRDLGNTVVVVEHDEEMMRAADLLIDLGPGAGLNGGRIVFQGKIPEIPGQAGNDERPARHGRPDRPSLPESLTLQYLSGAIPRYMRAKRPWHYSITVKGAMEHNLKDIDVRIPLGVLTVVSGVSGSGKSSLVGDILYPALNRRINETGDLPGLFRGLEGNVDRITRVEYVDQNPIGKSSRSNAVTYLKVYDDIRKLLSEQQAAKISGFTPSFFSFNQEGGRCPECQGDGFVRVGMQFMADVTMVCEACGGKRFKPEILEVKYKGRNIDDILEMSVEQAIAFFGAQSEDLARQIARRLQPLVDVGLGYIKLGQSSSTLSGGESQRIKLAYFLSLSENERERILFIFDEPTTGLHFFDVEKLLRSFDALLSKGHSIVVVEHTPDVIRNADWVIDLGPDAGDAGGEVVFAGTPEDLVKEGKTFTAKYLQ